MTFAYRSIIIAIYIITILQGQDFQPGVTELRTAGGELVAAVRDEQHFIHLQSAEGRKSYVTEFDRHASNGVIHIVHSILWRKLRMFDLT